MLTKTQPIYYHLVLWLFAVGHSSSNVRRPSMPYYLCGPGILSQAHASLHCGENSEDLDDPILCFTVGARRIQAADWPREVPQNCLLFRMTRNVLHFLYLAFPQRSDLAQYLGLPLSLLDP